MWTPGVSTRSPIVSKLILSILTSSLKSSHIDADQWNFISPLRKAVTSCKAIGSSCNEDCECCGYDQKPKVRCEQRNKLSGYQCFKSVGLDGKCVADDDCRSQKCVDGWCVQHYQNKPRASLACPITDFLSVAAVKGTRQENICSCEDPHDPSSGEALKAVDGDRTTVYENNWAVGGGIEIQPRYNKRIHSLQICNSDDNPNFDPTCYKLEGYCDMKGVWETIQEGGLLMPLERNECVTVKVSSIPWYIKYRITFPCQRGTCRDSCCGDCHAAPKQNPFIDSCPNPVPEPSYGTMSLISRDYEIASDRTLFTYEIDNIDLSAIKISWKGDCMIDYYYMYRDVNGEYVLSDDDAWRHCGNDFVFSFPDDRCMEGLNIAIDNSFTGASKPGKYLVKLYVRGEASETTLPYLAKKIDAPTQAGTIASPMCPRVLCPATCPFKVSEITLFTTVCDQTLVSI